MSKNSTDLVREFHKAFERPIRDIPDVGTPEERVLRVRLMLEEVLEFAKAANIYITATRKDPDYEKMIHLDGMHNLSVWCDKKDDHPSLVQMAHELADIQYVVSGTGVQLGIPINECVEEIHAANMRKLSPDGKPIVDEHGKVRKPDGWEPADVGRVLARFERDKE